MAKNHYSFSQLKLFETCPYAYYQLYIERAPLQHKDNFFSQRGTFIHSLIDDWAKGKYKKEDLPIQYKQFYGSKVSCECPKMLAKNGYAEKMYNSGLEYFEKFDEFADWEILESEYKFETFLNERKFVGIIDMIVKDKKTGEHIIVDHKSKSLASFKKESKEMYKQQYIYAKAFQEKYGYYPEKLAFNLFSEGGLIDIKNFDESEYKETLDWANDLIDQIENADIFTWFENNKERSDGSYNMYCKELCDIRESCIY